MNTIKTRIKLRKDTSIEWEAENPILLDGEIIVVDTNKIKIGNGSSSYNSLPFVGDDCVKTINNITPDSNGNVTLPALQYSILPISQSDYDALIYKDPNTLYIIEV